MSTLLPFAALLVAVGTSFACSSSGENSGTEQGSSGGRAAGGTGGRATGGDSRSGGVAGQDGSFGGSSGTGGFVSAGGTDHGAGGAKPCVDTSSDPANCGTCGHVCGLVTIASATYPRRIAVDDTSVYWANDGDSIGGGSIMKVSVDGGTPVTLASNQAPGAVTVDATHVYWTNPFDGTVMKVEKTGGTPTTLASGLSSPDAVAVDAANVYFRTYSAAGCPDDGGACRPDGAIMKLPKGGGTPTALATGQMDPGGLAIDGTNVYWTNQGITIFDGEIVKAPLAGGAPTKLASKQPSVGQGIAVDSANVYWTSSGVGGGANGTVMTVPIDGGTPKALASGPSNAMSIVVDATSIYWVEFDVGGGSVKRMPLAGGAATTLVSRVSPGDIAVGTTNVFFTSTATSPTDKGSVTKLGANTCESGECRCPAGQALCFGACVDHCG